MESKKGRGRQTKLRPEQTSYMEGLYDKFDSSRRRDKLQKFWTNMESGWFRRWPEEEVLEIQLLPPDPANPDAEPTMADDDMRLLGESVKARKAQLHAWFNNRSQKLKKAQGGSTSQAGSLAAKLFSSLRKKKRRYQEVEIYQKRHKAEIDRRVDAAMAIYDRGIADKKDETYIADQEVLSDEKRYLHSSLSRDGKRIIFGAHHKLLNSIHDLRTLDCDTTFKPVIHDRAAFKAVWEEVQRLVLKLTRKRLKFKGLHKGGKILGLNSDMEAAPLLGFADAFVTTIDLEDVCSVVGTDAQKLLPFVLRVCYSHYNRGIPLLSHLSKAIRQRIFNLKYLKTRAAFEAFKAWIQIVPDPHGVLRRWWEHKTMHRWLLPGLIQCLSNIPLEQWNTMEATTNLGEAQHAWNNNETGTGMGALESFKK
ncbi:hypothetical protein B0H10DRAFT_2208940 [Mycena sp. CBHHK59/15]|nr:hypothetical protein B0H10DRAFT_2208940 [Mycena sp. CBHHK59/15]